MEGALDEQKAGGCQELPKAVLVSLWLTSLESLKGCVP